MVLESQYHLIDMLFHNTMGVTKMWTRFRNEAQLDDELDLTDKREAIDEKLSSLHQKMTETPNPSEWKRDFTNAIMAEIICLIKDMYRYQECTVGHQKMALNNKMTTLGFTKLN
jgi:hypothetical protein